jgi:hypothetical protein
VYKNLFKLNRIVHFLFSDHKQSNICQVKGSEDMGGVLWEGKENPPNRFGRISKFVLYALHCK